MSNTESSAITRFIADAQNPRLEPTLRSEPAQTGQKRLARGTVAPHDPMPSPRASTAPHLGHEAWFEEFDEIEGLVEDESAEPSDAAIPIDLESQVAAPPAAPLGEAIQTAPVEPVMLAPEELQEEEDPEQAVIVAAPLQSLRVTSRPGSVLAHLPVEAVAAMARAQDGAPFRTPTHAHAQLAPSFTESTDYLEPTRRPGRAWLWAVAFCAVATGAYLTVTALQKGGGATPASAQVAAPAVTGPVSTPVAAADPAAPVAPAAPAEPAAPAAAAVPAPAEAPVALTDVPAVPLSAGFELPGIAADTRVILDGKPLGEGPMRVLRLAPGPHRLELVAAGSDQPQVMQIDLAADRVTALVALAPAGSPGAEAVAEAAPEAAAEAAPPRSSKRVARTSTPRKVVADKPAQAIARSKPAPKPRAVPGKNQGLLLVNAKPPCEIFVDGKRTGLVTPQRDLPLKPGTHTVLLVNAEHRIKKSTQVKIVAGKSTRLILDLTDLMR